MENTYLDEHFVAVYELLVYIVTFVGKQLFETLLLVTRIIFRKNRIEVI